MKSLLFFLSVLVLLGTGTYFKLNDEILFTDGIFSDSGLAPVDEWKSILSGKWEFRTTFQSSIKYWALKGEVEYTTDGNFTRFVSAKYFSNFNGTVVKQTPSNLKIIGGGRVSGKWAVRNEGAWEETINDCDIAITHRGKNIKKDFSICDKFFPIKGTLIFGKLVGSKVKTDTKIFNRNKIVIKGKTFDDDGEVTFILDRISI